MGVAEDLSTNRLPYILPLLGEVVSQAVPLAKPQIDLAQIGSQARPIAVLHVFRYFRPDFTGEGLYLEKLAPLFGAFGLKSDLVVEGTRPPAGGDRLGGLGRVTYFGRATPRICLVSAPLTAWFIRHAWRYDVVHFHSVVERSFLLHLVSSLFGCRVVQSCTLDDSLGRLVNDYRPRYRPLVRRLCGLIDAVVAISPKLYDDSITVLPPERVHLIPQGVIAPDLAAVDRASLRAEWGFAADDVVLLFVGGLCARKDVKFLIENHQGRVAGARVWLVVVGPDLEDVCAAGLRAMAAFSPFNDTIMFVGYRDDPSAVYSVADVFVFASRSEGFGNVLLEAMSYALPVVSRRLPGVTDYFIEHGQNGFLFDTATEYADSVRELAEQPRLRQSVGAAARTSVATRFDLGAIAARYVAVYRDKA